MTLRTIITGLTALALAACSQNKEPQVTDITLAPVDLPADEAIFGSVISMERVGNYLILLDTKADSLYHLVDITGATPIRQFGRKGNGPGEFSNLTLSSPIPGSSNSIGIFDASSKKLTIATIAPDGTITYTPGPKINGEVWQLIQLANGNYITSPGYAEHYELLNIFAPDGSFIARTAKRPMPDDATTHTPQIATAAWQYNLTPSPDGTRISAMGIGEAAAFMRLDGDSIVTTASFFNKNADHDHNFSAEYYMGISGNTPFGFVSQAVSDQNIYIIVSDRAIKDCSQDDSSYITGDIIKIYDWNGNHTATIHTDKRLRHITSPTPDGTIYAITEDGCNPTIVKFKI
jgi:hypothetical protein